MSIVHNEQTKLTATAVNNVALAFGVAGFVAPLVAVSFGLATAPSATWVAVTASLVWLVVAGTLHVVARGFLKRLRE